MNSINFPLVAASAEPTCALDLALNRLGEWLDAELGSLEVLVDLSATESAIDEIETLRGLHLEAACTAADFRCLLRDAQASLRRLLDTVREISVASLVDPRIPPDYDAWTRWCGARLEDISNTLSIALEN